jgi:putative ATP-binding cassette transporter
VTLLQCISAEGSGGRRLVFAASVAGLANVLLLACINASASATMDRDLRSLVMFLLLVALYALCSRHAKQRVTFLIESLLHRIKVRVGDRVAEAELAVLERVRAAEICDLITENTTLISDRTEAIAALLQSAVIMAFAVIYILWLSPLAAILITLVCAVGAALFVGMRRDFVTLMGRTAKVRLAYLEHLMDLIAGFREVQFSRRRGREIRADVGAAALAMRDVSVRTSNLLNDGFLIGQVVLFALAATVIFGLRSYADIDAWTIAHLFAAVMFLWGPFMNIAGGIMPYTRSNAALRQIAALEARLGAAVHDAPPVVESDPWGGGATRIVAAGLGFSYATGADDGPEFSVGPVDLEIAAGEVVFIVGGNGSGKSTLVKVLLGLYAPVTGSLRVDDVAVDPGNVAAYRDMISAIFSDFHLFPRLYGLEVADAAADHLIARMQMSDKVRVVDGAFSTLALSTGQRKRLAMVIALLEDRPICVFDEWAADQDPEFRAYFYDELLPSLRRAGKLVVVVSHDDRYFHCADQVVTLEYGTVRTTVRRPQPGVPA